MKVLRTTYYSGKRAVHDRSVADAVEHAFSEGRIEQRIDKIAVAVAKLYQRSVDGERITANDIEELLPSDDYAASYTVIESD